MEWCRKIVENFVSEHVEITLNDVKKTYLLPIILWWDLSTEVASVMDGLQLTENVHIWSTIHLDCKVRSCTVVTCGIFQFLSHYLSQMVKLLTNFLSGFWIESWYDHQSEIFLSTNLHVKTNGLAWVANQKSILRV